MATILLTAAQRLPDSLASVLRDAGHHVLTAADGDQAVRLARLFHVDLLITDRQGPDPGVALIDRLRREPRYQQVPVILFSDRGPVPRGTVRLTMPVPATQVSALVHGLAAADGDAVRACAG